MSVEYSLSVNSLPVYTGSFAVVIIDAKSFSVSSNSLQKLSGTPEVVLIYQQVIKAYVERQVKIFCKDKQEQCSHALPVHCHFTGGDAAILLFRKADDALDFLKRLSEDKTSKGIVFSAGATYGEVSYCCDKSDMISVVEIAGFPVSMATRLQTLSHAGRLLVDLAFLNQLEEGNKVEFRPHGGLEPFMQKNTAILATYFYNFIDDIARIADTGTITLRPGTIFGPGDWDSLWKLLSGGQMFLTMNWLAVEKWVDLKAQTVLPEQQQRILAMAAINEIYPSSSIFGLPVVCRIFIYQDEELDQLTPVLEFHRIRNIPVRTIKKGTFDELVQNALFSGPFSISRFGELEIVANYEYHQDPEVLGYRSIRSIHIPKLTAVEIESFYRVYRLIYEAAVPYSSPSKAHVVDTAV